MRLVHFLYLASLTCFTTATLILAGLIYRRITDPIRFA